MHLTLPDPPKPIIVLSSGGKDSMLMVDRLLADPAWDVRALVTTVNESNGRVAMHGTPESLIRAQAEALGLPLCLIGLPEQCDNDEYERRLQVGLQPFLDQGVAHVACGDLFLADIRQWREALFERLGWQPVFPLWLEPTDDVAADLIRRGFELVICCVDTHKLPKAFLGRTFDQQVLNDLPEDVDPCGENGEFHSFVFNGPGFAQPVAWCRGARVVVTHDRYAMIELAAGH